MNELEETVHFEWLSVPSARLSLLKHEVLVVIKHQLVR